MEKKSIIGSPWRLRVFKRLDIALILLEFVLSAIFLLIAYPTGNIYFKGVGVGLLIAWVTSAIAYLLKSKVVKQ